MYYIKDEELKSLFSNRIIQHNNFNSNSELFIYDNKILKIYMENHSLNHYNIEVVKKILNKQNDLSIVKELILPIELINYNNKIVGFSMIYANGLTLHDIIKNNIISLENTKIIFKKIIKIIEQFKKLPFDFYLGDLHEKNIILDKQLNIKIIDCDSFIIDNYKFVTNEGIRVGRYLNNYFDNKTIAKIGISGDYFCLYCVILNYLYKNIIKNTNKPLYYIERYVKSSKFKNIADRLNCIETFYLDDRDIDNIFESTKDYEIIENSESDKIIEEELAKEIKRIRKK